MSYRPPKTLMSFNCGVLVFPLIVTDPLNAATRMLGLGPPVTWACACPTTSPFSTMSPGLQQASRLMSLPPGSTPIVWIRDPRPVVIPPEQDAIVIFPGSPRVPATVFETFPLIVCAHPDLIRMSPACWLFEATTTEAPRSMTTVQLVLISIPG